MAADTDAEAAAADGRAGTALLLDVAAEAAAMVALFLLPFGRPRFLRGSPPRIESSSRPCFAGRFFGTEEPSADAD